MVAVTERSVELYKFLSFRMGQENFGLGILAIKEIIEYRDITDVPMMPGFVRGAINLRGHVVAVIDLAVRMGRPPQNISRRTCVVIVEVEMNQVRMEIGLMVEAVNEVLDILPSNIDPAPSFGGAVETDFIHGMGKIGDRFLILLNIEKILSLNDLQALSDLSTPGAVEKAEAIRSAMSADAGQSVDDQMPDGTQGV